MLIVDQNRKTIINFDEVDIISIDADDEIWAKAINARYFLGKYLTPERTREVLQKFVEEYKEPYSRPEYGFLYARKVEVRL